MIFKELDSICNQRTKLINALALSSKYIYIVNAYGYITMVDKDGRIVDSVGIDGYGKYALRQPVAITATEDELYVCDWFNQRVVKYSLDLKYIGEFGHHEIHQESSKLTSYFRRFLSIYRDHRIIHNHSGLIYSTDVKTSFFSSLNRVLYFIFSREIIFSNVGLNKPNGLVVYGDKIFLTQKNNRCLTLLSKSNEIVTIENIKSIENEEFGRLGNVVKGKLDIYICDEENNIIYILDENTTLKKKITNMSSVSPFTCCEINEDVIVIGGVKDCVVYSLKQNKEIISLGINEVHSLGFDEESNVLFIANRKDGLIKQLRVYNESL